MTTGWSFVASIESHSRIGKRYEIKRRESDGLLGCSCVAYRFAKGEKTCKHLQAFSGTTRARAELTVRREVVAGETFTVRRAISFEKV